jgi:hypothetical protein
MHFNLWQVLQTTRLMVSCVLIALFVLPQGLMAQTHVVSPAEIHKELVDNAQMRQRNLEKARQLFSLGVARKSVESAQPTGSAQADMTRVDAAVSKLSDEELAQLASRADKIQQDFAAGRLSDRDLLLIILGVVALVLIIVAVR